MKRIIILTFLLLLIFCSLFSQEQLNHQKKWYIDENGKFYTNKHLPVYIRLSHSPKEDAPSHLLESKTMPQYTNPMYFDTEGYNTIRSPFAVDTVSKRTVKPKTDIKFEVYADGKSPKTYIKYLEAKRYFGRNIKIYGKGLKIELTSKDAMSGVDEIYYSINGREFEKYSEALEMNEEGNFTIKFYAVDNVGNVEKIQQAEFIVDLSPPTTMHTFQGNNIDGVLSPNSKILLTAEDKFSGVSKIMYFINDEKPRLYTGPIPLANVMEGNVKFGFFAIDNVDNSGNTKLEQDKIKGDSKQEFSLYLDKSGPKANVLVIGDKYQAQHLYISERSNIAISASDEKTNVKNIFYGINENAKSNTYTNPINMSGKKGIHYINYMASDELGNYGANNVLAIYVDKTAPFSNLKLSNPQFAYNNMTFISKNTDIEILSNDRESGIQKTIYSINNENFTYNDRFKITEEGKQVLKYSSVDNVNNAESEKSAQLTVDNTAPEIFVIHSIDSIGTREKDGKIYPIYPNNNHIFLAANDIHSGLKSFSYSINNGKELNYMENVRIELNKFPKSDNFYIIKVKAIDKLGNTNDKIIKFFCI